VRRTRRVSRTSRTDDRGSVTTEMVLVTPLILVMLQFLVFVGRSVDARSDVVSAARDAARAASIQRDLADARAIAEQTAHATLDREGIRCLETEQVEVRTTGTTGDPGGFVPGNYVRVRVTCPIRHADLFWLAIPGARSSSYEAVEVVDVFRSAP
jgi:TadE-like protein